jgi:flagellar biosynthesis protein FlhB
MVSRLDIAVMVSEALSFALPIAFGSALAWGAYTHLKFLEMTYTMQSSGVGSVFQYIVFSILWVAFFWLVIASVIAGGIEMATAGARPVLEMFGLPIPKASTETGFRTMFTAIVAWELVNAILQSVFGVTPPSPVSALMPPIKLTTIGFIGTAAGLGLGAVILVPLVIQALANEVVIEL